MSAMRRALARFRQRTVLGLPAPDVVLAALLCAIAVASVLTGNPVEGPIGLTLPVAVVTTLALAWRRRLPLLMIGLIVVAGVVQTLLSEDPGSLWSLVVYAIAMYSLASWSSEPVAAAGGGVFVVALLFEEGFGGGVDQVFILLLFGGVWLLGRAARSWRGRVSLAERRQQEAAALATAEERLRIARDLHDVIAHSLGAIAVQADAAEAALQAAPDRALAPVRAIRDTARGSLTEIRRVLAQLRAEDAVAAPDLAGIPALVDAARSSGATVALTISGDISRVPTAVSTVGYRIVQEALTNSRKHAPGTAASVAVQSDAAALDIRIENTRVGGPPASQGAASGLPGEASALPSAASAPTDPTPGHGLIGMRERVRALGGTLDAGPSDNGGFVVHARLPVGLEEPA
jgi:signal transduction histidine kinase